MLIYKNNIKTDLCQTENRSSQIETVWSALHNMHWGVTLLTACVIIQILQIILSQLTQANTSRQKYDLHLSKC